MKWPFHKHGCGPNDSTMTITYFPSDRVVPNTEPPGKMKSRHPREPPRVLH